MNKKIKNFLFLGRYHKPYGSFLLMFPCFWGLAINSFLTLESLKIYFLFAVGSFIMRGAGCTINDILDLEFNKKVKRTKKRPLANGDINIKEAYFFLIIQLLLGLIILLNFNQIIIFNSLLIVPLVFAYPLLKRITFFPQVVLGILFNWGILLSGSYFENFDNIKIITLFLGGVFLTIGYDTIYAYQDIKDDKKIGLKSLALKTFNRPKTFITLIYLLSFIFFSISILIAFPLNFLSLLLIIFIFIHLSWQIAQIKLMHQEVLQNIFTSNVYLGSLIFVGLLINKNSYF